MSETISQRSLNQSSTTKKSKRTGRRTILTRPAKVLAASIYSGLAALVRLTERRVTRDPEVIRLYNEIRQMWKEARKEYKKLKKQGVLDFTPILKIEHNMRKNYLGMLWYSTRPYGNTEFRRVYNWREGTVGPLNELLNYAGAMLRSIATKYYSFPKVHYYQVREYPDGRVELFHRSKARKYPPEEGVEVSWTAAYPGSSKYPLVRVRHSTLPEMDFVDMIRAHVVEMVRQCFIHNVQMTASRRYIRLLIFRLQPFLDWLYTDGKTGRSRFWPDADRVLREIVLEVRALYSRRLGRTPRLTQQLESGIPRESTLVDIVTQINRAHIQDTSKEMRQTTSELLKLMGYLVDKKKRTLTMRTDTSSEMKKALSRLAKDMKYKTREVEQFKDPVRPALTDDDAQNLYERILQVTQREGNDWHRVLFGDMFHPSSLRQVVFAGDNFLDEPSDYLIAVEVPVNSATGSGKADIVVFVRRSVAGEIFWTPIMVLDVKTKTGINWALQGKRPRTKKEDSRVPGFIVRKRSCTISEWSRIVSSTPNPTERSQLQSYESGLIDEYAEMVKQDPDYPKTLWKGVILLDSDEDRENMFTLLPQLVQSVITDLKAGPSTGDPRTLYTLNSQGVRKKWQYKFGLVLLPSTGPQHLLEKTRPLETVSEDDPFRVRVKDDVHFTLYLTVPSGGSSGESAAWISRNWHLLHYLSDLKKTTKKKRIMWLDLTGDLTEGRVRLQRLCLVGNQKPRRMSRRRLEFLQQLAEKTKFQDLSSSLEEYFFTDSRAGIQRLEAEVSKCLRQAFSESSIIVIDGWSQLRNVIPTHLDSLLRILEHKIIEWLPKRDVEIVWLDRPVPVPIQSATYQLRRVSPLPHDSPRYTLLDEVIWNLPTSPRNFGWRTPRREDIRVIAQDTPTSSKPTVKSFGVPYLRGWARRFRADSRKERTVFVEEVLGDVETYGRSFYSASYVEMGPDSLETVLGDIYQLVPSLSRVRDASDDSTESSSQSEYEMRKQVLGKTTYSIGMWDRVSFIPQQTEPDRGRPGTHSPVEGITRGKIRKPPREIPAVSRMSRRPPILRQTPKEAIDTDQTRHDEVIRVHKAADFLITKCDPLINSRWHGVLEETIKLCKKYQRGEMISLETLDQLQALYPSLESSEDIWKNLSYERRFGRGREQIPRSILSVIRERPELLTRYGNSLFLLLHGVMNDESTPEIQRSHIPTLWSAVADWQWVHMGFKPWDDLHGLAQHRYDIPALWSNLLWRARWFTSGPVKSGLFESHRFGELIPRGNDQVWLVFQEKPMSPRMIAGLITGAGRSANLRGIYDTVVNLVPLAEDAEYTLEKSPDVQTIVITRFEEMNLLWAKSLEEYDEREWALIGKIVYRPPKEGMCAPIRRVTFSGVPKKVIERLTEPDVDIPADLGERVKDTLGQIVSDAASVLSVSVKVSLNKEDQMYLIHLVGGDDDILEELEYETTDEVIGLLRNPFTQGEYYQSAEGGLYTWEPRTDISYEQIDTENGPLSLTFLRPRVENVRFLNGTYVLPKTGKEVLATNLGEEIPIVASPDLDRYKKEWKRCWNVWFAKSDLGVGLQSMEYEYCTIYDIALLFECRQIIDTDTGLRHPTQVAINKLDEVDLPEELTRRGRMRECFLRK